MQCFLQRMYFDVLKSLEEYLYNCKNSCGQKSIRCVVVWCSVLVSVSNLDAVFFAENVFRRLRKSRGVSLHK